MTITGLWDRPSTALRSLKTKFQKFDSQPKNISCICKLNELRIKITIDPFKFSWLPLKFLHQNVSIVQNVGIFRCKKACIFLVSCQILQWFNQGHLFCQKELVFQFWVQQFDCMYHWIIIHIWNRFLNKSTWRKLNTRNCKFFLNNCPWNCH